MIDTRGYSCPIPVSMVQKEIKNGKPSEIKVLLDAQCAVENVTRFAQLKGYTVSAEVKGDETILTLTI